MYVRHEVIRARAPISRTDSHIAGRSDPFAQLVRQVHEDPGNAYNLDRYLWVLEEPPARPCAMCGARFDPWFGYAGGSARGYPRRYCSTGCRGRAAWARRCRRGLAAEWRGRAA